MESVKERVDKKWFGALILALLVCCLFLGLTFDLFVEYQIIGFISLLVACSFLIINSVAAIKLSKSTKQNPSKSIPIITFSLVVATSLLYYYHHGAFYGQKTIDAAFLDERSSMHLSLYDDGHYIVNSDWMFGSEDFSGIYRISENSIILDEYSPDNKILPKYLVKYGNKLFFSRDRQGQFQDTSFYYFKINNATK